MSGRTIVGGNLRFLKVGQRVSYQPRGKPETIVTIAREPGTNAVYVYDNQGKEALANPFELLYLNTGEVSDGSEN